MIGNEDGLVPFVWKGCGGLSVGSWTAVSENREGEVTRHARGANETVHLRVCRRAILLVLLGY